MSSSARLRLAALVVFLGIALGAFGAHGLADRLEATGRIGNWQTATLYHLLHGLALFVIALHSPKALGYWWFLTGILLFSGSLYALALTDFTKLGAITPLGGLAFLIGWGRWIFHRSSPVTPS
ncbi:MAG: DUF423 domain-containing protein [Verrucomicrobiales bacterium]|jgi:uncharacterized membrane protein YgdD (TMEM256/DUF423 family)|nr:DUF423 domain-containing protein [Verrucomicrobiales bacterium]MBP9222344.1 DUF423 domain-containing protein [Verrucomicrobiales bacterium]HQZ29838.1 DUF423 domain-containing protein [Verrucomicrobiales bacterium]